MQLPTTLGPETASADAANFVAQAAQVGLEVSIQVDSPGAIQWWGENTWCSVSIWFHPDNRTYTVSRFAYRNKVKRWARVYKGRVMGTALKHAIQFIKTPTRKAKAD